MKKNGNVIKLIIILVILCAVLGGYYLLSNRDRGSKEETQTLTKVQEVLTWDLENYYPATPKEVIKTYSELTECFYNETYTDEELEKLASMALKLYDDELVANKSYDKYLTDLKTEIAGLKSKDYAIYSYSPSASTDVKLFSKDGYECASLYCTYTFRMKSTMSSTNLLFILRKDTVGHWRILGWEAAEKEE